MGLRERKKAQTRDVLAEAAMRLFEARGFDATTADDIAAAADVSRRTFFRYFGAKEDAAFPLRAERLARFEHMLESAAGATPFERAREAFLALAEEYVADRASLLRQSRVVEASPALTAHELKLDRAWEDRLARALGDEIDPPPFAARVAAGAVIGAIRASLRAWFDTAGAADLTTLGREAFGLLAAGLERPWARPSTTDDRARPQGG